MAFTSGFKKTAETMRVKGGFSSDPTQIAHWRRAGRVKKLKAGLAGAAIAGGAYALSRHRHPDKNKAD